MHRRMNSLALGADLRGLAWNSEPTRVRASLPLQKCRSLSSYYGSSSRESPLRPFDLPKTSDPTVHHTAAFLGYRPHVLRQSTGNSNAETQVPDCEPMTRGMHGSSIQSTLHKIQLASRVRKDGRFASSCALVAHTHGLIELGKSYNRTT